MHTAGFLLKHKKAVFAGAAFGFLPEERSEGGRKVEETRLSC
jgi:hypothetical protein